MSVSASEESASAVLVPQPESSPFAMPGEPVAVHVRSLHEKGSPQHWVGDFWKKFSIKNPGKVFSVLPDNLYARTVAAGQPKGVADSKVASANYDEAVAACKAKVEQISRECRRINQKYRDLHFNIDTTVAGRFCLDSLGTMSALNPGSVRRVADIFDEPQFFIDGATDSDVKQGFDGDCWFIAAVSTLCNMPGLIEKICVARDEQVGVYGFVFFRDGEWLSTIIDDKLYLTKSEYSDRFNNERWTWDDRYGDREEEYRKLNLSGSKALYFAKCRDDNETWLPLIEKAYAKAHGDYAAIEGGFVGEAIEDLCGGVTTEIYTKDILDRNQFWQELLQVNQEKGFLFGCYTGLWTGGYDDSRTGIVEGHAYSVMRAVEVKGERLLLIRNPWGHMEWTGPWADGSKEWTPEWMQLLDHTFGDDGAFWISFKDFLRKFELLDRTRLFGSDWSLTQRWTSFDVPWTTDYHPTKFRVTLEKASKVVLVLSQLDDRYFRGLVGQYSFVIQFRLQKEGEEGYIVRSHGNYAMSRSVAVEVELEQGSYLVLVKIIAERDKEAKTVTDQIRENAENQREKLLQAGLSYDLAHAKGQLNEALAEKRKRAKEEKAAKKAKEQKKAVEKEKRGKLRETRKARWQKAKMERQDKRERARQEKKDKADELKRKAEEKLDEEWKKEWLEKYKAEKAKKEEEEKAKKEAEEKEKKTEEKKEEKTEAKKEEKEEKKEEEKAEAKADKAEDVKGEKTAASEPVKETKEAEALKPDTASDVPSTVGEHTPSSSIDEKKEEVAEVKKEEKKEEKKEAKKEEKEEEKKEDEKEASKDADEKKDSKDEDANEKKDSNDESADRPEAAQESAAVEADEPEIPERPWTDPTENKELFYEDDGVVSDAELTPSEFDASEVDSDEESEDSEAPVEGEGFSDDPWNAVCVVGLRVYSQVQESNVEISVVYPQSNKMELQVDVDEPAADVVDHARDIVEKSEHEKQEAKEQKKTEEKTDEKTEEKTEEKAEEKVEEKAEEKKTE